MPAKAGIHLQLRWKGKENLDSGRRRNDDKEESIFRSTNSEPFGSKTRAIQFLYSCSMNPERRISSTKLLSQKVLSVACLARGSSTAAMS
jgi:hypothetical protein